MVLDSPHKCNPLAQRQEKGICLISKVNYAYLEHRRSSRALIIASDERLKSFLCKQSSPEHFVCGQYTSPLIIDNISAIVIPTIRGECTTHRNCSQLFHSCLQRNISSCRDDEFRDG